MAAKLHLALVAAVALLSAAPATGQSDRPVATDARLVGEGERTRLVVDLTAAVEVTAFALSKPDRVVVDLPEVAFSLDPSLGREGRGLISAYRYGLFAAGRSRIVIDLAAPALIDKAFVLPPTDGQPARLVVDLTAADRGAFERAVAMRNQSSMSGGGAGRMRSLRGSMADPDAVAAAGGGATVDAGDKRPVIVLDPGHGGVDPGASSGKGEDEKTIVLEFARALRDALESRGRYRVVMTREDDTFVGLSERAAIARAQGAALFLSIHADTLSDPFGVRGATVYTLSETASDAEAAKLAEKENRADVIAGLEMEGETAAEVADILMDLTRRETKSFSGDFAKRLVSGLRGAARMNKNPLRSAGFKVLKSPDVPSALLELGYLSSADDLKALTSAEWRGRATEAVAAAIDGYFATRVAGRAAAGLD